MEGRVQKVGLRYLVVEEAEERDITGYVKNLRNGTVEVVCEGKKEDIDSFVEAMRRLREPAVVENVRSEYSESRNEFVDFHIEHEDLGKDEMDRLTDYEKLDRKMDVSIGEITHGFSAATKVLKRLTSIQHKMLDRQDESLAKQDESLAKQGEILSEIRNMSAKQGETLSEIRNMSAKQGETLSEIRNMSAKQDESLAKQDETLSEIRNMSAKQDKSLAKQDETLSEIRNVSAKQGETVSEIRNMSSNMNAMLDSRFQKLESEIAKIKHKMEI